MNDKDEITFTYREGYYNSEDIMDIPQNCVIPPTSNLIYNKKGKPISLKDLSSVYSEGGSRSFLLDNTTIGFLGVDNVSNKGIGNMFQGISRNLWFVGNSLSNGVRVLSSGTLKQIGGTYQVETVTVTAGCSSNGNIVVRITASNISGSPVDVTVAVLSGDTTSQVATKIKTALQANTAITAKYYPRVSSSDISLTSKTALANNTSLTITLQSAGSTGVTFGSSINTTAGIADTIADLSSTPQVAKWNGSSWDNPVQVGLAPQTTAPTLVLTTDTTRNAYFSGIITGSISGRIARKRNGSVSIASGTSNIVTGDTDSVQMTVPDWTEDGSLQEDRLWLLYFTFKGKGSLDAHFLFPIEVPESKLDGSETLGWSSTQGNARIKVISQHASDQSQRVLEIEFYDNDLAEIEPFDDYFSAESCKFMAPLGNVLCLIGTGDDGTGFDVSFPNFREAFSPDWRDWFSEVPVSLAMASEQGMFWVCTANRTYQAIWTGATQETAPVILREVSSKLGAIGEAATVSINGILYGLSKGNTPYRISPDGSIDIEFGIRVKSAFSTFDSTTQIGWDEATNSVIYLKGHNSIAYQIDTNLWGSLTSFTTPNNVGVYSCFSMNGFLYICSYDISSFTPSFTTHGYNLGGDLSWSVVSAFQSGKSSLLLKDIIEARVIAELPSQPYTITFSTYRDWNTSGTRALFSYLISSTGIKISKRQLLESLDYESISLVSSGTGGGQTVPIVNITVDIHDIEREQ